MWNREDILVYGFFIVITVLFLFFIGVSIYNDYIQHQEMMCCLEMKYPIEQCILINNIQ